MAVSDDEFEGLMRKFVSLFREHLDFLEENGLTQEFNDWLDARYGEPDTAESRKT